MRSVACYFHPHPEAIRTRRPSLPGLAGNIEDEDAGIDPAGKGLAFLSIEIQMRKKIGPC
jgi:hypothetical protein